MAACYFAFSYNVPRNRNSLGNGQPTFTQHPLFPVGIGLEIEHCLHKQYIWHVSQMCKDHLWGGSCAYVNSKTLGILMLPLPIRLGGFWNRLPAPGDLHQGHFLHSGWRSHRALIICLKALTANLSIPQVFSLCQGSEIRNESDTAPPFPRHFEKAQSNRTN